MCRENISKIGYAHFCQAPHCAHDACGKCKLFSDTIEDDIKAMKDAGLTALQQQELQQLQNGGSAGAGGANSETVKVSLYIYWYHLPWCNVTFVFGVGTLRFFMILDSTLTYFITDRRCPWRRYYHHHCGGGLLPPRQAVRDHCGPSQVRHRSQCRRREPAGHGGVCCACGCLCGGSGAGSAGGGAGAPAA